MISDEEARLGRAVVETAKSGGGWLAEVLGDLPKDLLGLLVGDRVKVMRAERLAVLWAGTKKRLEDRGIKEPEPPSLKLALPILAAAADENREELLRIWESLLAAAMDPKRRDFVRQSLIVAVKELDPLDVLVFNEIRDHPGQLSPNARDFIAGRLGFGLEEVFVSFENLERLKIIKNATAALNPSLLPLGYLLIEAVV